MKCMHDWFIFIVLNVRDGNESKYPSIVFLSIVEFKDFSRLLSDFPVLFQTDLIFKDF